METNLLGFSPHQVSWTGQRRQKSPCVLLQVNPSFCLLFNFLYSGVTSGFTQHFIQVSRHLALTVQSELGLHFSSVSKLPLWNNGLANELSHNMLAGKANSTSHCMQRLHTSAVPGPQNYHMTVLLSQFSKKWLHFPQVTLPLEWKFPTDLKQ